MTTKKPDRISFTKKALTAIRRPPEGERRFVRDKLVPSLAVQVTATGAITFYRCGRVDGTPKRIKLGTFPAMTVEQARTAAAVVNGDIAKGLDPQAAERTRRGEMTFGALFAYYMEHHAKHHKKTWQGDQWQYDKYLSAWKNRQLSLITRTDVQSLHARIGRAHGHYTANRVLALVHAVFNKGVDAGWDKPNPAHRVKKFKEQSRERFLGTDELPRFFDSLAKEPNETLRDFFVVALLTGARRANVQAMKWADVNLDTALWRIPTTKSGDAVTVPLMPQLVNLLTARRDAANGSPFVFPSRAAAGHIVEPKSAWKRICQRANLADLRIHDLRRTLGSWQAAGGASLPIIGKSLGHRNTATTQVYARLTMTPVRESVERAGAAILTAGRLIATTAEPTTGKRHAR